MKDKERHYKYNLLKTSCLDSYDARCQIGHQVQC